MEKLQFTTRVLGEEAASRLENHQVTRTLRSVGNSIVQAILTGKVKLGDQMQVILDDRMIGLAQYFMLEIVNWGDLDEEDARRGGFDNLNDLAKALQRAGYRFQPLEKYKLYRLRFTWLEGAT